MKWVERGLQPFTLTVGQQRAVALPAGRAASWQTSDATIATVSQQGVVTAQKPGTARIIAYANPDVVSVVVTVTEAADSTNTQAPPPDSASAQPSPYPAAMVTVSLDTWRLGAGQTTRATAVAKDTSGKTLVGKTPVWASQNAEVATVSSTGVVTAVGGGSTMIQATIDGVSGATALTVVTSTVPPQQQPATTASVTVTLDSANLAAGHATQARFVAKDANGIVLTGKTPTWTSLAPAIATVASTGVVTGVSPGSAGIQATVDGIVGAAPLTVTTPSVITAPTPPPPPAPSASPGHPNEPAGFTQIVFHGFDEASNSDFAPGSNVNNYSIVTDVNSPEGSTNVGQMFFHAGMAGGIAPGGVYPRTTPFAGRPTSVYVSFWVLVSSSWTSPIQSGANKILYFQSTEGGGKNLGSAEFLGFGFDIQQLQPAPTLENIINVLNDDGSVKGAGSVALPINRVPYTSSSAAQRGVWGHYEILMIMNTPGQSDGTYKWWWNGQLYGDYSSRVRWTDTPGVAFSTVYWEPTYGGSTLPVPTDQFMRLKNLYVSGR